MTTYPTRQAKTEIPIKATLLTVKLAEQVLEREAEKTKKSQTYYDRDAKDLNELRPGDIVRINPKGLVKGQEWRKGSVIQSHGYRSYDIKVVVKCLEETF